MRETRRPAHETESGGGAFVPRRGHWPLRVPSLLAAAAVAGGVALALPRLLPASVGGGVTAGIAGRSHGRTPWADRAESLWRAAEAEIRQAKRAAAVGIPGEAGPGASAFVGAELTTLVTTLGSLEAKRTASQPAWAGRLADEFRRRGIGSRSVVAALFSGSFPGLNAAVVAACQALGADLIAVSSVTASTWGANQPGFTWPEMEARLVRRGLLRQATAAVSLGGSGDRGMDLDDDGRALGDRILEEAARDLGVPALRPRTYDEAIALRLALFRERAGGRPIALFVNVGGTDAGLGQSEWILRLKSGFLPAGATDRSPGRGLVAHFAERGVPVLLLLNVRDLAVRWRIRLDPSRRQ